MWFIGRTIGNVIQGTISGFAFTMGSLAAKEWAKLNGFFPNALETPNETKEVDPVENEEE